VVTLGDLLPGLEAALWPPLCSLICQSLLRALRIPPRTQPDPVAWPWLCGALGILLVAGVLAQWAYAGLGAANAVIALAIWWWRRRKGRKRAPRAFGYKGRALLATLAASLRENLRPRPALRPHPGGAPTWEDAGL
jgi:hypothetical protein